ncbi:hypothetical protein HOY82DRAFT_489495, partial [Tuber indicum]
LAVPQSPATAAPVAPSTPAVPSKEDTNLACQWTSCQEKFETPEDLYNHLCDIHVGRKSTNNLCLTCAWGTCRTTTVKRDHITSHIRVHVPLKPHKCEFCQKAFKRPQDLKKHVKTHADDSVLLRSPEPDGLGRRASAVHQARGDNVHGQYTTGAGMQPLAATAAQAYYGIGTYYPGPNQAPGAAPVYYYNAPQAPQQDMAQAAPLSENNKKRNYDGMDQFFDDAKRHKIQPVYDGAMAQRLSALQFVPTTSEGVDFNGHHAPTVTASPSAQTQFTLPSLRTKQDLIDADNFLTQLSANVYENPAAATASGVPAGGAHFTQQYRPNQPSSPHGTPAAQPQQHSPSHTPVAHDTTSTTAPTIPATSNSTGTPALTPPSQQHSTPPTVSPQTSASMYPTLPAAVTSSEMSAGYPAPVSTAPPTSLGPTFESEQRRRISVGVLQKASRSSEDTDVDMGTDDIFGNLKKNEISSSLIDPELGALSGETMQQQQQQQEEGPPAAAEKDEIVSWERNIGVINSLRDYVKELLREEDEKEKRGEGEDHIMTDHDGGVDASNVDQQPQEEGGSDERAKEEQTDAQALYPVLRAVAVA